MDYTEKQQIDDLVSALEAGEKSGFSEKKGLLSSIQGRKFKETIQQGLKNLAMNDEEKLEKREVDLPSPESIKALQQQQVQVNKDLQEAMDIIDNDTSIINNIASTRKKQIVIDDIEVDLLIIFQPTHYNQNTAFMIASIGEIEFPKQEVVMNYANAFKDAEKRLIKMLEGYIRTLKYQNKELYIAGYK